MVAPPIVAVTPPRQFHSCQPFLHGGADAAKVGAGRRHSHPRGPLPIAAGDGYGGGINLLDGGNRLQRDATAGRWELERAYCGNAGEARALADLHRVVVGFDPDGTGRNGAYRGCQEGTYLLFRQACCDSLCPVNANLDHRLL